MTDRRRLLMSAQKKNIKLPYYVVSAGDTVNGFTYADWLKYISGTENSSEVWPARQDLSNAGGLAIAIGVKDRSVKIWGSSGVKFPISGTLLAKLAGAGCSLHFVGDHNFQRQWCSIDIGIWEADASTLQPPTTGRVVGLTEIPSTTYANKTVSISLSGISFDASRDYIIGCVVQTSAATSWNVWHDYFVKNIYFSK